LLELRSPGFYWRPRRPVGSVQLLQDRNPGWQMVTGALGFRCQYLVVYVEHSVLEQPGWPLGIRRAWRQISQAVHPFYGEVRTLRGYSFVGSALMASRDSERSPVGYWWRGIPAKTGHAFVIGSPYAERWTNIEAGARREGELLFVETPDWSSGEDAASRVGGVPPWLTLGGPIPCEASSGVAFAVPGYAPVFPFPRPGAQ
jgi:hypothetical protein